MRPMSRNPKLPVPIHLRPKSASRIVPSIKKKDPHTLEEDYTPPSGMEHYLELADLLLRRKKAA